MSQNGYDIIGDIHGCAQLLVKLLNKLGYENQSGVYRYQGKANRQVIFLGDVIDRGPDIVKALEIVKSMVDAGQAQMILGNHEFNAIAYFTPQGENYLRPRSERAKAQMKATLDQFNGQMSLFYEYLNWFKQLPIFLDLGGFRAVHGCWDQKIIDRYIKTFSSGCLSEQVIAACVASQPGVMRMIKRLTCGINLDCPKGFNIIGRDGYNRSTFRAAFWRKSAKTYHDIIFQPDPIPSELGQKLISYENAQKLSYYGVKEKPLFIGHYWLQGEFSLVAPNIACLDYSAVSGGKLMGYQFNQGDEALRSNQYVAVESSGSS